MLMWHTLIRECKTWILLHPYQISTLIKQVRLVVLLFMALGLIWALIPHFLLNPNPRTFGLGLFPSANFLDKNSLPKKKKKKKKKKVKEDSKCLIVKSIKVINQSRVPLSSAKKHLKVSPFCFTVKQPNPFHSIRSDPNPNSTDPTRIKPGFTVADKHDRDEHSGGGPRPHEPRLLLARRSSWLRRPWHRPWHQALPRLHRRFLRSFSHISFSLISYCSLFRSEILSHHAHFQF